jgi:hypothetical protein
MVLYQFNKSGTFFIERRPPIMHSYQLLERLVNWLCLSGQSGHFR